MPSVRHPALEMLIRFAVVSVMILSGALGAEIDFNRDIRPILTSHCTACHGGVKEAGGISFVFREKALATGESGKRTIVPGNPDGSELIRRVTSKDPDLVMPQPDHGPPLDATQIDKLCQWIQQGAKWSEHWAFVPPAAATPPMVQQKDWPKNDIDRFVLARLEEHKLKPNPQAGPALLLRRLSFDLTGLSPTLAELDTFEAAWINDSEAAWQSEIKRLLASPHYGECWAVNWLDLARYADTEGLGSDGPRTAWPFRDWVIKLHLKQQQLRDESTWLPPSALQAVSEQVELEVVAGDGNPEFRTTSTVPGGALFELRIAAPENMATVTALRIEVMPVDPDTAIHTAEWGPVLSRIKLHATPPGGSEVELGIARVVADEPDPFLASEDSLRDNRNGWGTYTKIDRPRSCVLVLKEPLAMAGQSLRLTLHHQMTAVDSIPLVTKRGRVFLTENPRWTGLSDDPAVLAAFARVEEIDAAFVKDSAAMVPVMESQPPHLQRPTHLFVRGNWLGKGERIEKAGIPAVFGKLPEDATADRLTLAKWLVSPGNPLTARVAANRIWEQLFGLGLVGTLEDFGSSGSKPSHPELLDHLALRFRDTHGWSQKALLREIVSSAAYRQSAATTSEGYAQDMGNRMLARSPRTRLSAEAVRDHALVASGLFAPAMHGPPVFPPMPPGGWTPFASPERWDTPEPGHPDRYRRAIYTYTKRSNPYPGFSTFDAPPREICSKRRILSNTPLRALDTLNSPAHAEFAEALARRLVENGTRFVQLFDWGWDSHGDNEKGAINIGFKNKCLEIDRPISALLGDLKQRGLLEDTLVIWSGEFGRTPMQENRNGMDKKAAVFTGRDHNPNSFTLWMAGAGVKPARVIHDLLA